VIDAESFASQFTECYQRMWLIAAAITGDRTEADDIVQEASLIGLAKRGDFVAGTNFAAWISQIVRLTALNYRKKSERRKLCVTDPVHIDQSISARAHRSGEPVTPLAEGGKLSDSQMDFDDEVLSALDQISDVARICLLLRVLHQLSYDDIAQTLNIPAGTAMSHVHRAKQTIRERLQGSRSLEHCGQRGNTQ
jgi:RNA polymerase sigma-70 factor (ECF subfamily)